jgi:hypothetical protein
MLDRTNEFILINRANNCRFWDRLYDTGKNQVGSGIVKAQNAGAKKGKRRGMFPRL